MPRQTVRNANVAPAVGPFSAGVIASPQLVLSGQVAQDPDTGKLVEGDAAVQARQVLTNIMAVLSAADRTEADIIRVGVYLTSMDDFAAVNSVYAEFFTAPYPARTAIAVSALPLGALVEMDVMSA